MKKIFLHIKSPSNATATTDEAERSFGENDSLLAIAAPLSSSELCSSSSPMNSNNKYNHQNSSSILSSTQSSISSTTTSLSRNKKSSPLKLKQLKRKFSRSTSSKDDSISEARERAAARNVPPPFTTSKLLRLNELKEAKLRAEERREERSLRGGGSGGGRDYGSSSLRGDSSIMSIRSTRTAGETSMSMGGKEIAPIDEIQFIQQNGIMFVTCLLLQFILLPFYNRHCTQAASSSGQSDQIIIAATTTNYQQVLLQLLLPISLIIIQSLTLYTLLNTILVYAIDNINVGQNIQLVSNLDFGKRLYIVQVVTYTKLLSVGVGVFSVVGAMVYNGWRRLLGIKWVVCQYLNLTSSSCCKKMCNDDDGAMLLATNMLSPVSSWAHQAYNVSTFVTVRMIVFILAVLLLGHWKTDRMPRQ